MESSSTGRSNVKSRMKRGVSSIITLLRMGSKQSDEDDLTVHHPDQSSLGVTRSGLRAGFTHANDSNATTVVRPPRLRLTGAETPDLITPHSAPLSPRFEKDIGEELARAFPHSLSIQRSRRDLRRSQSTPGLSNRISNKLNQAFGSPTTVKKSELRARPSVQQLQSTVQSTNGIQLSSSPSTYNSWSTSSPLDAQKSTPGTSDPATPSSVYHNEGIVLIDNDRAVHFPQDVITHPRLTPIPEGAVLPGLSIVTVEATATAKTFFEAHFNLLLNGPDARAKRRSELEKKLKELHLPVNVQHRILSAWERNESDNLRLERAFKAFEVGRSAKSVAVGKYEVVKVLGKGSFGVVRLVKEKPAARVSGRIASTAEMIRQVSHTLVKSPRREAVPTASKRNRELSNVKKEVCAMKVIRKSDMLRNSQEGHLRAERDFLVAAEGTKWVIPLVEAFQDTKFLYLVMDFCIGGDFLGLLIRKNTLSEEITKWYIAEMILCVEEAHALRWIHRDVKPDNFLIGADGHLKISDFGLAFDGEWYHDQRFYHKHRHDLIDKLELQVTGDEQDVQEQAELENSRRIAQAFPHSSKSSKTATDKDEPTATEPILDWRNRAQKRRLARSVVGTSQYMAPEVIRGDLYDGRCDWWSIGVIMYECLYGYTPFACEDRHNTKLKILKHKHTLKFPECEPARQPSMSALDLMQRLLVEKEKRLCCGRYELNDFTKRFVGGQTVKFSADKASKNYQGLFVYPDDAEDIKRHPYFGNIRWETMLERRPPFVPRVKDWEDTKYFDEEQPISDIDSVSSDEEAEEQEMRKIEKAVEKLETPPEVDQGSKASQHHHEDQHIIPSTALKLNANEKVLTLKTPDGKPIAALPLNTTLVQHDAAENVDLAPKKNKEKKRPRDKILRDPETGKTAVKMREKGAFLGYAYRKPKGVDEIVAEVVAQEQESMSPVSSPPLVGYWSQPLPREEIC